MSIDLKAIRERDAGDRLCCDEPLCETNLRITDRRSLLAVVDSAREYIRANACHADSCRVNYGRCTCHVGETLRELGEAP